MIVTVTDSEISKIFYHQMEKVFVYPVCHLKTQDVSQLEGWGISPYVVGFHHAGLQPIRVRMHDSLHDSSLFPTNWEAGEFHHTWWDFIMLVPS